MAKTLAILGAGSWGTAVAIHLAHSGNRVLLWAHDPSHVQEMTETHENSRYLPSLPFPDSLTPTTDLNASIAKADYVIVAVPSHAFKTLLGQMIKPAQGLIWLTKGIDPDSHLLLSQLVAQHWGEDYPIAILSGPSFAKEVARLLPTAVTLASNNAALQKSIQQVLHQNYLRVYVSHDLIGVQICGAVKNVLAIACGISDGLGYGANAKAALITRGLAEMSRLGSKMGAKKETFLGLAGVGDLVLTCTDDQSRNRRFGLLLGQGHSIPEAEEKIKQVVEGKYNSAQVCLLAKQYAVDMPICMQVNALLHTQLTPEQAVLNLMTRSPRKE